MKLRLKGEGGILEAEVSRAGDMVKIKTSDATAEYAIASCPTPEFIISAGDIQQRCFAFRRKDEIYIHLAGRNWSFRDVSEAAGKPSATIEGDGDNRVVAPMPGSVIKLMVEAGAKVIREQPLVIVEAMKMENEVRSPMDGKVEKVLVAVGQQVGYGELLLELAAVNEAGG